ncbi:PEP-CTERM sorting domain-containing protein [Nostoc sp. TCL26-01]|uniref:PEP-CTERM sorting domain-containing protein n=1 Tax=Nostoc sp. TCL26-01 TaxID=2576904 RepID=UPI0015BD0774|nr:PEP-CTERM sorting domain-containing protein [Nostoc sp. TCL26-01]QLE58345.1 PEP-CTERM sorting domain-containing protein [Nostoc sp. TCL26-01]
MLTFKNISFNLFLGLLGLLSLPTKALAGDFHYSQEETVIFQTDFDSSSGWLLNGTKIESSKIYGTLPWGVASYPLQPVNLELGEVFLYWRGIFPLNAHPERDKHYVGLQYSNNDPVCYNSQSLTIVGTPPCTGSSVIQVDENAELRLEIRPRDKRNPSNTYHRYYIDPGFDPQNNYSPASTQVNVPTYRELVPTDFRLQISQVSSSAYTALLSSWQDNSWVAATPKTSYSIPLSLSASDWLNAKGEIENPVTFAAINLQFRKGSTQNSEITAVALTQIQSQQSASVTESSTTIGLPLVLGFGLFLKRQRRQN